MIAEDVVETCFFVSSVHRSAPARAMRFLTYKVFSNKNPQVNRSLNTNLHKKQQVTFEFEKKTHTKKTKNAAKTKKQHESMKKILKKNTDLIQASPDPITRRPSRSVQSHEYFGSNSFRITGLSTRMGSHDLFRRHFLPVVILVVPKG